MRISEFIESSNQASSKEEVLSIFLRALNFHGLDRFVYSYMTDNFTLNKRAQHGVLRNYPESWMKYYQEKNYKDLDPVYNYALQSRRPFAWNELESDLKLNKNEIKVMNESREALLLDGAALSIRDINGEVIGMGFASSTGGLDLNKNLLSTIHALANQFHIAYTEFEEKEEPNFVRLTMKEREVLLWAARGKSDYIIAEILGISVHGVDFHFRNIFRKLQANSRVMAIVKALRSGMITP